MARERDDRLIEHVVRINRCATVVKGGRRFSFSALVIVGDGNGRVGFGYGKANEVPPAVEKGVKDAKRNMLLVPRIGTTIPHQVWGRFGASKIMLLPACEGTGVIAGAPLRAIASAGGIRNILTKSFGSNSPINLVRATFDALRKIRTREQVERLRGVSLESDYLAAKSVGATPTAPILPREPERRDRPPRGDRRGGGGGDRR